MPRRALGYARVSSQEQAIGTSLEDQQNVIRAHAQKGGLNVARMYVEAESAVHEKIERREQIRALMAEARKGDVVLVDKVDRWSRDPEFTYRSMRELRERGVDVYFIGDACNPSTPEGDTMLNFRVLFAREEHKRIKLRMVGTRKALRNRGYYADGLATWGYHRQDVKGAERNTLVLDDAESVRVREVFRLCIRGRSLQEIADQLGEEKKRIHTALRNRVYLGEVRDARGVWITGKHAPIITPHLFAQAREALDRRRLGQRRASAESRTVDWWLRDVAYCARCEAKMTSAYGGTSVAAPDYVRFYFACRARCTRKYVPVRRVEEQSEAIVLSRLVELREALASSTTPQPRVSVDLEAARERLESRRARISRQHEMGAIGDEELRQRLVALDDERTRLDAIAIPQEPVSHAQRRAALRDVAALGRAWGRLPATDRRQVINGLASRCLMAAEKAPRFDWYSAEDLARRT